MANSYSLITSIEIHNFMSIEHAVLEFDQSNIISICGFNDTGKSAITRAISILFYDNYSRDQAKFIKEGKDNFLIKMSFADGVSISKTKFITGVSIWELRKDDSLLYTNKLETGVQAVTDVPEPIKQYLGVLYDDCTDSLVNVRRNTDRLFLIDTTGGDNYKILNTILQSDILAKASMSMTQDKNRMNSELQVKVNQYNGFIQQCESMDVAPEVEIKELVRLTDGLREITAQAMAIDSVKTNSDIVKNTKLPEKVEEISVDQYKAIDSLKGLTQIMSQERMPEIEAVDLDRLSSIASIKGFYESQNKAIMPEITAVDIEKLHILESVRSAHSNFEERSRLLNALSSVEMLPTEQYMALKAVKDCSTTVKALEERHAKLGAELEDVNEELLALSKQYNFKVCKNCGTIIIDECDCAE